MRRSSLIAVCIALLLSCGYASASPDPQRFTICDVPNHFYVSAGELAGAKVLRESALIEWQHSVAKESRFSRSDMHASSAGFVFSAVHSDLDTGDAQVS